jgi:hypothetical protein
VRRCAHKLVPSCSVSILHCYCNGVVWSLSYWKVKKNLIIEQLNTRVAGLLVFHTCTWRAFEMSFQWSTLGLHKLTAIMSCICWHFFQKCGRWFTLLGPDGCQHFRSGATDTVMILLQITAAKSSACATAMTNRATHETCPPNTTNKWRTHSFSNLHTPSAVMFICYRYKSNVLCTEPEIYFHYIYLNIYYTREDESRDSSVGVTTTVRTGWSGF